MKKYFFLLSLSAHTCMFLSGSMDATLCLSAQRLEHLYQKCQCHGIDYAHAQMIVEHIEACVMQMSPTVFIDLDSLYESIMNLLRLGFMIPPGPYPISIEEQLGKSEHFFQKQLFDYLSGLSLRSATNEDLRDFVFSTIWACVRQQLSERGLLPPDTPPGSPATPTSQPPRRDVGYE